MWQLCLAGSKCCCPLLGPNLPAGARCWGKLFAKLFPVIHSHLRDEADVALIWAMHAGIIQANYLGQG